MSLLRNTMVQAALTLGSRVLGLVRDLFISARLGQGPLTDALYTAFAFPNLFRRLFAEGAFAQAFVPAYAREKAEKGDLEAARVASEALSCLIFIVGLFVVIAQIAMPWIMLGLLSGYRDEPTTFQLAILLTQITMPYLAFMAIASLLSGVLNTAGRFALSAGVPSLMNLTTLVPLVLLDDKHAVLVGTAIGLTLAGILQAGALYWGVRRLGVRISIGWPRFTPEVRSMLALSIPGAIAGGALQLNSLTSQFLSGTDEAARSVLYNADRLYQLPLGLIGVAIGLALVPRLSRYFLENDHASARAALDDGLTLSMALTAPAMVAIMVIPFFIMDGVFTRGAFTSEHARRVADVLVHFGWGVPAFVLAKVFTPPFFARQDTRTPMNFALVSVFANIVLGVSLWYGLKAIGQDPVLGVAVATSATAWLNVLMLVARLKKDGAYSIGRKVWGQLFRIALASLAMGAVLAYAGLNREQLYQLLWTKELAVVAVVLGGMVMYFLAALLVRALRLADLKLMLRREKGGADLPGGLEP